MPGRTRTYFRWVPLAGGPTLHLSLPLQGAGGPYFCYFCKGNARIFVSIQRAAIKQRVGSVGFYERCKLADVNAHF